MVLGKVYNMWSDGNNSLLNLQKRWICRENYEQNMLLDVKSGLFATQTNDSERRVKIFENYFIIRDKDKGCNCTITESRN